MLTDDLWPCPFCGGKADFERLGTRRQSCIVACGNCGARHESSDEDDQCGSSWNTRATLASSSANLDEWIKMVGTCFVDRDGDQITYGSIRRADLERLLASSSAAREDAAICGESPTPIDADLIGCGLPISQAAEVYRCTDCGVPFHRACAIKHFATDTPENAKLVFEEQLRRLDATRSATQGDGGRG